MPARHPLFSVHRAETIAAWGEVELLRHIKRWLGPAAPPPPHGMGDDTAVLPNSPGNLLTTDSLVYGRHFTDELPPEVAGAKLIKRNLSDIAAMGGVPTVAVLAGFFPANLRKAWLEGFVRGLAECAHEYHTYIVGGDLAQIESGWSANLTLLGDAKNPRPRSGSEAGDWICVTGEIGASLLGWHARFTPRLAEGQWLASQHQTVSMIDLTDGLAKDLPALLRPGLQAFINRRDLPLRVGVEQLAKASGRQPWQHGLGDGEDYELLFTWRGSPQDLRERWSFATRVTCIGRLVEAPTPDDAPWLLDPTDFLPLLEEGGYEHFR